MIDPLSVRLTDGKGNDRQVRARELRFRKTAPGGHQSASCSIFTDAGAFIDLGPNDRLFVHDVASGECVWEGYTDNPGKTLGPSGEGYDISALGGAARADDAAFPYVLVEQRPDGFVRSDQSTKKAKTESDERSEGVPSWVASTKADSTIATTWEADLVYRGLKHAGMKLARAEAQCDSGINDGNFDMRLVARNAGGSNVVDTANADLATHTLAGVVVTNFANGRDQLALNVIRSTSSIASDPDMWFEFWNIVVVAMRLDQYGDDITTGYGSNTVLPHQIVKDMIGRGLLPAIDPDGIVVDTTTYAIDQAAWKDGVTGAGVLDWLTVFEPDYLWEYLTTDQYGRHAFRYRKWDDTTARYEVSTSSGFEQTGGDDDLCNRIAVGYTDKQGKQRTQIVTQTVEALGTRVRDADSVSLPEGMSSPASAQRIGEMLLRQRANPPKAARAVIRRPIVDRRAGRLVNPWEIEPGYSVVVRETGDLLRLTEVEYDHESRSSTLVLGTPVRTVEQLVAQLSRRGRRKAIK